MMRRPSLGLSSQNVRLPIKNDYGTSKSSLIKSNSRSGSPLPLFESPPPSSSHCSQPNKPTITTSSKMNTMSILYVITLICVVLYSKHYMNSMRIHYQTEQVLLQQRHDELMQKEHSNNERVLREVNTQLQSTRQDLSKERQVVASLDTTMRNLQAEAKTTTDALKQSLQDVYRRNAIRE